MELIERVARAVHRSDAAQGSDYDTIGPVLQARFGAIAKAAIRAVLDGVEPYAWHCVSRRYPDLDSLVMDAANTPSPEFEETPLYSLDALKEGLS